MSMTLGRLLPEVGLPLDMAGLTVSGMALDSRQVAGGKLFFAVPGARMDGRQFIDAAVAGGAAAVLREGEEQGYSLMGSVPVVTLPGLRQQLGHIAARYYGRPADFMNMIGITGTNGKSSAAWFARDALNALGKRCALIGTLGIHFDDWSQPASHTTPDPLTLQAGLAACRQRGADTVVMEVSSHALVQHRLNGVPFSSAVFTNLSRDHLDYHGDMDSYFAAKAQLFHWPGLQLAVVNSADQWGRKLVADLAPGCRRVTYAGEDADVRALQVTYGSRGLQAKLSVAGAEVSVEAPLFGPFNLENLMAVAALLHGQGVSPVEIAAALNQVTPVPGRMEPVAAKESGPTVLVDYAHTPDGLEKALQACRAHFSGRLWCVVGCGGDRDQGKRPQMAAAAEAGSDQLVLTSDNPRSEAPGAIIQQMVEGLAGADQVQVIEDRAAAISHAIQAASQDDVVLLAGKGHEDYQDVGGQRLPFSDRLQALAALEARTGRADG